MLKLENTYWNSKGKYQTFLEEKLDGDLIETLPINEKLKEKYRKIGRMYYRFFNDGDIPEGSHYTNELDQQVIANYLEYDINLIIEEILLVLTVEGVLCLDIFEVIQELYKDQSKKAISKKGEIKWIERTLDNPSKDKVKDLVYINVNGFEHNIMRDIVLESLNCKIWVIVE